jgi:hypothetical protein
MLKTVRFLRAVRWKRIRRARKNRGRIISQMLNPQTINSLKTNHHILEEEKYVSTLILGDALTPACADVSTFAVDVGVRIQCPGVLDAHRPQIVTHSHLHRAAWARHLAIHPDKTFAKTVLDYVDNGVPIGYNGPEFNRVCKNWQSTVTFHEAVSKIICTDILKGRKSGPFDYPPLANFIGSPMGAFKKKHSKKV